MACAGLHAHSPPHPHFLSLPCFYVISKSIERELLARVANESPLFRGFTRVSQRPWPKKSFALSLSLSLFVSLFLRYFREKKRASFVGRVYVWAHVGISTLLSRTRRALRRIYNGACVIRARAPNLFPIYVQARELDACFHIYVCDRPIDILPPQEVRRSPCQCVFAVFARGFGPR